MEQVFDFPGARGGVKHDWDVIFNGQIWRLRKGEDYQCRTDCFVKMARHAAKRRKLRIRTRIRSNQQFVFIQVVKKDGQPMEPKLGDGSGIERILREQFNQGDD